MAKAKTLNFVRNQEGHLHARPDDVCVGDFSGLVSVRSTGASAGTYDFYMEIKGVAAETYIGPRTRGAARLRSKEDIARFFNNNPHLNTVGTTSA